MQFINEVTYYYADEFNLIGHNKNAIEISIETILTKEEARDKARWKRQFINRT